MSEPGGEHQCRSQLLGAGRQLKLGGGVIECFERGTGPALLFCHGWLTNANLWRGVVDRLHTEYRCLVLDLPLGSHRMPMSAAAKLEPDGVAELIVAASEALELADATLVGNDSGGAYAQIALAGHGERLGGRVSRLVLTSCETPYDEWPPPPFENLPAAAADPTVLGQLLGALADPEVRATPPAYGLLLKRPPEARVYDSYALPASRDPQLLRDIAKVIASTSTAPVRKAGERLIAESEIPTLLVWSEQDRVFPIEHAERYAAALREAELRSITDAYSLTPEDRPDALATAIATFLGGR